MRVMSLDQCADQYALALAADQDLRLSKRADDPDSYQGQVAVAHARVRGSLEQAILFRPDVVLRTWGGDARLIHRLEAQGAEVVTLPEVQDFAGARTNLTLAGQALGQPGRAAQLAIHMDRQLQKKGEPRGPALYVTAGGFTSGPETFINAILTNAGFANAEQRPGFRPISIERLVMDQPRRLILGFFDLLQRDQRGAGRHPALQRKLTQPAIAVPATLLSCPAWFAADAVEDLRAAP